MFSQTFPLVFQSVDFYCRVRWTRGIQIVSACEKEIPTLRSLSHHHQTTASSSSSSSLLFFYFYSIDFPAASPHGQPSFRLLLFVFFRPDVIPTTLDWKICACVYACTPARSSAVNSEAGSLVVALTKTYRVAAPNETETTITASQPVSSIRFDSLTVSSRT